MGEAKRRKLRAARFDSVTKELKRARFDLYTLGTRLSPARLMAEELAWWSDNDEQVIGMAFRDTTDNDFGWNLLARDGEGRFRWVKGDVSISSLPRAVEALREVIATTIQNEDVVELGKQGDEGNVPYDLLRVPADADRSKLHPYFKILLENNARAPTRAAVREIGPWLAPSDPHFVRQFQFDQFDQRLWELYLWASMRELGFDVVQGEAPDFQCSAPGVAFTIEATTASVSTEGPLAERPDPNTPEEMKAFLKDYMPMKFGGCLTSKLNAKNQQGQFYWERDEAKGKPFILAVADFHHPGSLETGPGSMTYTQSALWPYLYGHRIEWEKVDGRLNFRTIAEPEHTFGKKKIPSGFFDLPNAENISAVLFSNAGTLSKFTRMGVVAGFAAPKCKYIRIGTRFNSDPNAVEGIVFADEVDDPRYVEFWSDELQIFHNPNAKIPLPTEWFGDLTQHWFKDHDRYSVAPDKTVLGSITQIFSVKEDE